MPACPEKLLSVSAVKIPSGVVSLEMVCPELVMNPGRASPEKAAEARDEEPDDAIARG